MASDNNNDYVDMTVMLIDVEMNLFTIKTQAQKMRDRHGPSEEHSVLMESVQFAMGTTDKLQSILQTKRNEKTQKAMNAIDLIGLPDGMAVNIADVAKVLTRILHFTVTEDKIVSCDRIVVPPKLENGEGTSSGSPPNILVIHLSDRDIRDRILDVVKETPLHMHGAGCLDNVTISEHLTYMNQMMFRMAREQANSLGIQYVWVEDGEIFVRRSETSRTHRIRSAADVETMDELGI